MIEVRDALPADRESVLKFWPFPERLDRRFAAAAAGTESLLVATVGTGVRLVFGGAVSIRWSGGCEDPGRPMLYGLEVPPAQRGRGLGTALTRFAARRAAARGFTELCLEVEPVNSGAIRLYRRLGFQVAGPHRHVWRSGDASGAVDVLIMRARATDVAGSGP